MLFDFSNPSYERWPDEVVKNIDEPAKKEVVMPIAFDEDSYFELLQNGDGVPVAKKVLIEGDSWVSHPQLHHLAWAMESEGNGKYGILNLADPGATAHEVFHKQSRQLRRLHRLLKSRQFGYQFDLIFLSAGGNDIIGPEIKQFLYDKRDFPGKHGKELINDDTYLPAIEHIVDDYRKILQHIRDSGLNRTTSVITHTYSYLQPREVGTHFGGIMFNRGWVARYMKEDKHIRDPDEQLEIVKELLAYLGDDITELEREFPNFLVVDTLKTLSVRGRPDTSLFHDEIHPNTRGFKKVMNRIKSVASDYDMWI